ncbi:C-terminal binding protein [Neorhizobium sp. Rsf11]|uniref:C-terminal binding protein n=2 Tax=Neorhizobium TaxID=1525371 RepID=A0ABV0LY28_9HYPH|nr:C-terminal binding protein [Neorhizobium petrolearium]MCC2612560.1 C-terminal binding protein [Neorhizobium petrolearium]WGI67684.1 C-terminal binding protein [Neorhizobium petrolearium]
MKIIKTDGMLAVEPEQLAYLEGLGAEFIEKTLLTEEALIAEAKDAEALMVLREPITARVLSELKNLKVIGRFGVGLDSIDVEAATQAGVQVTYVPDSNIDEVSTHALALILSLARKLKVYDSAVRQGRWLAMDDGAGITRPSEQILGLIGFGQIGRLTAAKARAFGYEIIAYDPYISAERISATGARPVSLDELFAQADFISLHIPATPETRKIISAEALNKMKKGAYVINVSRGGLVDEAALAEAIQSGHIAGAGIDTFEKEPPAPDNPLLALDQVIVSPHAAHYSTQSYTEVRSKVFADVAAVLRGEKPRYPVNFKE